MRPNNRQRSRGRNGGGGNHNQHKQQHSHNPNRPPNRNQIFDSSGPDVRVRGNAHQVYDKYQALAREAAAMGDRIQAEAYWQYADHYFRVIQSQGGFVQRPNQWSEGGEEGQQQNPPQDGQQNPQPQANNANGAGNGAAPEGYAQNERQHDRQHENRQQDGRQHEGRQHEGRNNDSRGDSRGDSDPGLGGVAFLQNRSMAPSQDPAAEDQPDVPEFRPAGRRGGG